MISPDRQYGNSVEVHPSVFDTHLLIAAFRLAVKFHATQVRKGSKTPYLSHLLGVTDLVWSYGGDDEEAAAALLHDAVEDGGGLKVLPEIVDDCGQRVADIVKACSDSTVDTAGGGVKDDWWSRKRRYIGQLADEKVDPGSVLVSACDKLHNLTATVADHRSLGDEVWGRFRTGWQGQLWYYRSLVAVYETQGDERVRLVAARLRGALEELERDLRAAGARVEDAPPTGP